MLKGIDPLLSPDLLKLLAEMGHDDAIVLADANFTAASLGRGKPVIALAGVVLSVDGPVGGHVVYRRSTGDISCAGEACDLTGATVVCTGGVISPGLVDAHNHLQDYPSEDALAAAMRAGAEAGVEVASVLMYSGCA